MDLEHLIDTYFTEPLPFVGMDLAGCPIDPGVYVIGYQFDRNTEFTEHSTGGRFKGKNPTVDPKILKDKIVVGSTIAYIGKAKNIRRRLMQFQRFGQGEAIGHWGGRYIWQVERPSDLTVRWRVTLNCDPEVEEKRLLGIFAESYGALPFANLRL